MQITDQDGNQCGWSVPAVFETGLLEQSDWSGPWIARDPVIPDLGRNECTFYDLKPAPRFRTTFSINRAAVVAGAGNRVEALANQATVVRARAYISGKCSTP